jgi:hypothetical protein
VVGDFRRMGSLTMAASQLRQPCDDGHTTRPRPVEQDPMSMEEIHADLLDHYHRETQALQQAKSLLAEGSLGESSDDESLSSSPSPKMSQQEVENSRLSETPDSVSGELNLSLHEGRTYRENTPSSRLNRSTSIDRRINEAARFFSAVGETLPPMTSRGDIQRIIEDDHNSESDEDDEATEVHVIESNASEHAFDILNEPKKEPQLPGSDFPTLKKRFSFFHRLPSSSSGSQSSGGFEYKGITNPPEITQRGLSRGNYALLHRKAWLEVSDDKHRYGKNLRMYYREWEASGHPTNEFFDWLDSKGTSKGKALPDLAKCPRSELDSDTVLYIQDSEVTKEYVLSFVCDDLGRVKVFDRDDDLVCTGPDGWIFVLRDNELYGAEKVTSISEHARQRFHHSSFFGGKAVAAAGILITDDDGVLVRVLPHSGHYRPGEADMQRMLFYLFHQGVDLRLIEVDTQQLNHINRKDPNTFKKKAKKDSLHLTTGASVSHYLSHKARLIGLGIFAQIHQLE